MKNNNLTTVERKGTAENFSCALVTITEIKNGIEKNYVVRSQEFTIPKQGLIK